ncbi:MAG: hypothetical protein H6Q68_2820 [Firmicutes bacterium]|nr:hypothetical protein [Bacillota bacterium]
MTVIRRLFNRKFSKFSALISLSALAAMFMLFFLFIPEFVANTAGQIFVGIWALIAALSFVAHGKSVTAREGRQYVPVYGIKKTERTSKARSTSRVRGL